MADFEDAYAARIRAIYQRAERQILEEVRRRAARGIKEPGWAERKAAELAGLNAWLRRQLPGMLGDVGQEISSAVQAGYDAGVEQAGRQLIEARLQSLEPQPYVLGASIRAIAAEATVSIKATHPRILRSTLDAYRDVIAAGAEDVLTGVVTRQQAVQRALYAFADRGITGFIDKAGRAWDLSSYADMAVRSAVINASVAGRTDKYLAAGEDLVYVSDHWEECPACRLWEGKVLSLTGHTAGYPTLADAKAGGLFHPGCRHEINLYVPGLTRIPARQGPKDKVQAERVYKERLTQRRLERGIRQWKRRQMAALDPVEEAKAARKVLEWQAGLDAHIEAVNARRSSLDIPAMKKQPGRERVIFAPDAKRTAREAAGFRRSVAAADRKAAEIAEAAAGPVVKKIDLDATKPQKIGTSADLRKVYPKGTPGADSAGAHPVVLTPERIRHIVGDHPERKEWLWNDPEMVRRAVSQPEVVSAAPKPQKSGYYRLEYMIQAPLPNGKPGYVQVVTSLPKDAKESEMVVTVVPKGTRDLFLKDGSVRDRYRMIRGEKVIP